MMMTSGDLRHHIRIERKTTTPDGYGGTASTWSVVGTTRAKIAPLKGGEEVRSARLSGLKPCEITVRQDSLTRSITPKDRLIDLRDNSVLNVRWVGDIHGEDRFFLIVAEGGGHDV